MRFQLLGPVLAHNDQGPVALGSTRQRAVLAVLLIEPAATVSVDQLAGRVWGPSPPPRARQNLHTYLSRLRGVFAAAGGPTITRHALSYRLDIEPASIDLHQFRALVAQARQATDDRAIAHWREALALWRGRPLADLDSDWLRQVATSLESEHHAATLDYTDARLRHGEHARLLPDLTAAVAEHPLDERLAGQLMLALYRCGRQADALNHYRQLHNRLIAELGSDPTSELRELHQRILRQDPALTAASPTAAASLITTDPPSGSTRPRPAQLPADVAGFTGRLHDLRRLDELLDTDETTSAVVITAIGGTAGVGKTALAIHWAHRVAGQFPDGQLYLNLRGYDPDQPVAPADALARLLAALGVTGQDIPLDLDDRAARYRSELAGRRMLVLLDNAASVTQVRPLLPGSGTCRVLVTSRDSLAGLVAVHGAHRIDLGLLPSAEAVGLLRQLIGARVDAEPEAAASLAQQCARLPLALRVAAELAVARPEEPLSELVAELADQPQRLELLDGGGDPHAAVQVVFSWSVQQLPPATARLFRLLGLHPGPDLDPYAAAALDGTAIAAARRALSELARAHLVHRAGPGRYGMHDLLRAYAARLAASEHTDQQLAAADQRLMDYYQATATAAMDTLHPAKASYRPAAPACTTPVPDLTGLDAARTWLDTERPNLMAVAAHAAARGRSGYVVGLVRILDDYLSDTDPTAKVAIGTHALKAAEEAGDVVGGAHALRLLSTAYNVLSQHELAVEHAQSALVRFRRAGDLIGEGLALANLSTTRYLLGDYKKSVDDDRRAIAVFRKAGDRLGEAGGLLNLATTEDRLGRDSEAITHFEQALDLFRQLGSRYFEAAVLNNLANVEVRQGRLAPAADHLRAAVDIYRELGSLIGEAHSLDTLGILYVKLGEAGPAADHFRRALDHYRATGERNGQAWATNGLGEAAQLAGRPAQALHHHTEALVIAGETANRHQQARAHAGLGHARRDLGEPDRARTHYEQAYAIYSELDMPDASDVLAHLVSLRA